MMSLGNGRKFLQLFLTTINRTLIAKLIKKPYLFSKKKNLMKFTEEQLYH